MGRPRKWCASRANGRGRDDFTLVPMARALHDAAGADRGPARCACAAGQRTMRRMRRRRRRWRWRLGLDRAGDRGGALRSYPGLAHRQQRVASDRRRAFVNDSKATNADAAARGAGLLRAADAGSPAAWPRRAGSSRWQPYFPRVAACAADRARCAGVCGDAGGAWRAAFRVVRDAGGGGARRRRRRRAALGHRWCCCRRRRRVSTSSPASSSAASGLARESRAAGLAGGGAADGPKVSRSDTTIAVLGRWWWSVDRWTLVAITTLIGFGYVMMLAASPAVAERIGETRDAFIFKQVVFPRGLPAAEVVCVSMLSPRNVRRLALLGCVVALGLTAMTLVVAWRSRARGAGSRCRGCRCSPASS